MRVSQARTSLRNAFAYKKVKKELNKQRNKMNEKLKVRDNERSDMIYLAL